MGSISLTIATLSMGLLILIMAIRQHMKARPYADFKTEIANRYDVRSLDLSGETEYVNCVSHRWALNNVARPIYGKASRKIQQMIADNTLVGAVIIGLITGSAAVIIGLLFVEGVSAIGASIGIFFVGALVVMGPSDPKISERFLNDIMEEDIENLCAQDYVYVSLALKSITDWTRLSGFIGITFLLIAPWAESIPLVLAVVLSTVVTVVIFQPALAIAAINFPLAFLYMAGMGVLIFYAIPRAIIRRIRRPQEEQKTEVMAQW